MPVGPGKYDDICTKIREQVNADGVILIIANGDRGNGISIQCSSASLILSLANMLEEAAKQIKVDLGTNVIGYA